MREGGGWVRSWATSDLMAWLTGLDERLSQGSLLGLQLDDGLWIDLKGVRQKERPEPGREQDGGGRDGREREERPEPLDRLVARIDRALVLGVPGSGKSEWLRRRARAAAREAHDRLQAGRALPEDVMVPVFLPLSMLAEVLKEEEPLRRLVGRMRNAPPSDLLPPEERVAAALVMGLRRIDDQQEKKLWSPRLEQVLWEKLQPQETRGPVQALVCLDSWDETSAEQKAVLGEAVKVLLNAPHLRVLMTSRPGHLEDGALFGRQRSFEIQPFSPTDTHRFITRYFWSEPQRGSGLITELQQKPRLAGFAENPLQATLLCMTCEDGEAMLPLRRGELYQKALDQLLTTWLKRNRPEVLRKEHHRLLLTTQEGCEDLLVLLQAIAAAMFPATTISRSALYRFLFDREKKGFLQHLEQDDPIRIWVTNPNLGGPQQVGEALCELGIMVHSGDGYGFLHTTFQEYLVARDFARRATRDGWASIASEIDRHAWNIAWCEVIILLAGTLADPEPLITLLADPDRDDVANHRTILAALALPELSPEARTRLDDIIADITTLVIDGALWELVHRPYQIDDSGHFRRALPSIGEINGRYEDLPLKEWLKEQIEQESPVYGLILYGGSSICSPELVNALLIQLQQSEESMTRFSAARALSHIGPPAAGPEVLSTLLRSLEDTHYLVRKAAGWGLGRLCIAPLDPSITAELLRLAADSDPDLRRSASEALSNLNPIATSPELLFALVDLLKDDDDNVSDNAMTALIHMSDAVVATEALNMLVRHVFGSDYIASRSALFVLGKLGSAAATEDVLIHLHHLLRDGTSHQKCGAAAILNQLGGAAGMPSILAILRSLIDDEHIDVRYMSAKLLFCLDSSDDALARLLEFLDHPDKEWRYAVLSTLGDNGVKSATPEALEAIVRILGSDDEYYRNHAAETLGSFGAAAATSIVLGAIQTFLMNENEQIRISAVSALGEIGAAAATPEIITILVQLMGDSHYAQHAVLETLTRFGGTAATSEVLSAVSSMLSSSDSRVRLSAVRASAGLGAVSLRAEVEATILHLLDDPDEDLIKSVLTTLTEVLCSDISIPSVLTKLFDLISLENPSTLVISALGHADVSAVSPELLILLIRLNGHQDEYISLSAMQALNELARRSSASRTLLDELAGLFGRHGDERVLRSRLDQISYARFFARDPEWVAMSVDDLCAGHPPPEPGRRTTLQ